MIGIAHCVSAYFAGLPMLSKSIKAALAVAVAAAGLSVPINEASSRERRSSPHITRPARPPSLPVPRQPYSSYQVDQVRPGLQRLTGPNGDIVWRRSDPHLCARNRICGDGGAVAATPLPVAPSSSDRLPSFGGIAPRSPSIYPDVVDNRTMPPRASLSPYASDLRPATPRSEADVWQRPSIGSPQPSIEPRATPSERFCADSEELDGYDLPLRTRVPRSEGERAPMSVPGGTCGLAWTGNRASALGEIWFEVVYRGDVYWASSYYLIQE